MNYFDFRTEAAVVILGKGLKEKIRAAIEKLPPVELKGGPVKSRPMSMSAFIRKACINYLRVNEVRAMACRRIEGAEAEAIANYKTEKEKRPPGDRS